MAYDVLALCFCQTLQESAESSIGDDIDDGLVRTDTSVVWGQALDPRVLACPAGWLRERTAVARVVDEDRIVGTGPVLAANRLLSSSILVCLSVGHCLQEVLDAPADADRNRATVLLGFGDDGGTIGLSVRPCLAKVLDAPDDASRSRAMVLQEDDAILADGRLLAEQERLYSLRIVNSTREVARRLLILIDTYKKGKKP